MDRTLMILGVLATTTAFSAAMVLPATLLARQIGVIDHPGPRKVHDAPTPRLGGLAVATSFVVVVLAGYFLLPTLQAMPPAHSAFGESLAMLAQASKVETKLLALIAGAALAFGIGLLDDFLGARMPVGVKALGQVSAAAIVVAADVRTTFMPWDWANALITFLWLMGITNAFNLLDNMNGLAAGVALVASAIFALNAWLLDEFFVCLMLTAFMGSLLGFLFFNFRAGSIFLGDCGSLFIGFVMASLTLLERYVSHASSSLFPILMPVLVLAVPIVDTATVVVIRLYERRPFYVGDSRHLSHRLVALGFSPRRAVLFLYLTTFCLGLGAVSLTDATPGQSLLTLLQTVGFVTLLLLLMFVQRPVVEVAR
jgi:UDP-GlcNAc:undecaprenyl-phosphate/decaprenyl-phosphate GlcNAc-1-phosphate transferase